MKKFNELYESIINEGKKVADFALVPGSFRPPGKHHWYMIEEYSKLAEQVSVIISDPKKARDWANGASLDQDRTYQIFEIYKKASGIKNIEFIKSPSPSPVKAVYDMIENNANGETFIAGASTKDNDWKRWNGLTPYVEKKNINAIILDPKEYAVKPYSDKGKNVSASDLRMSLDLNKDIRDFVPSFLKEKDIQLILGIIGNDEAQADARQREFTKNKK